MLTTKGTAHKYFAWNSKFNTNEVIIPKGVDALTKKKKNTTNRETLCAQWGWASLCGYHWRFLSQRKLYFTTSLLMVERGRGGSLTKEMRKRCNCSNPYFLFCACFHCYILHTLSYLILIACVFLCNVALLISPVACL